MLGTAPALSSPYLRLDIMLMATKSTELRLPIAMKSWTDVPIETKGEAFTCG